MHIGLAATRNQANPTIRPTIVCLLFALLCFATNASNCLAGLVISEVMYLPESDPLNSGHAARRQWVELYNPGSAVDLSNYALVDAAGTSFGPLSGTLGSGSAVVLYDREYSATGSGIYNSSRFADDWGINESQTIAMDNWQAMSMDNTPKNVLVLQDISTTVIPVHTLDGFNQGLWEIPNIGFSIFLTDLNSPESHASWSSTHLDPLAGSSMEADDFGTPGQVDFALASLTVPEPASLFTFAILGLVSVARRRRP